MTEGVLSVKCKDCQEANSKLELSQLLFISVRQRELVKSSFGLSTYTDSTWSVHQFPTLPCDPVTRDL